LIAPSRLFERRRLVDGIATVLVTASALGVVVVLVLILGQVVIHGLPALNVQFAATLEMLLVAALIGIPLGVGAAIYLSEYGHGRLAHVVSFSIDLIAGFPSIVIGVLVWAWLVRNVVGVYDGLAGGVALAIVLVPFVARTVEATLRRVPDALREASLALGIPRWKTVVRVVLPTAYGGIGRRLRGF